MKKVYTVFGETGEYSDWQTWAVVSFFNEDKAKEWVTAATIRAKGIEVARGETYSIPDGVINEFDGEMIMDYTGTSYYYETTDILDS